MKRKRPKDLTGQRFGRLVVVERMDQKTKYGCWLYRCKCDCGNEKIVVAGNLKAGLTKSCGCLQNGPVIDLSGKRFGSLTATKYVGGSKWECVCDCGNTIVVKSRQLLDGVISSCGCVAKTHANRKEVRKICVSCGEEFIGGRSSKYCPGCKYERRIISGGKLIQSGPSRKIGSIDHCKICGKEYVVNSGKQKFCPECIAAKKLQEEEKRKNGVDVVCQQCGETFRARSLAFKFCPKCLLDRRRQRDRAVDKHHQRHIGDTCVCPKCGKEYILEYRAQRYCPDCGYRARKDNI